MTLDSARVNWGKLVTRILLYFVVSSICILILYPYFVMFCTALKSRAEIFSMNGTILPVDALWSNFVDIWTLAPMGRYMINSVLVAGGSTLIAMLCGIPAAYALSRMLLGLFLIFSGIFSLLVAKKKKSTPSTLDKPKKTDYNNIK